MIELNRKLIIKTVLPRVLKAAFWGTLTFVIVYYLPMMLIPTDIPQGLIPFDIADTLFGFAVISVFFTVVGHLLAGTIIGCGFGIVKAIIIIVFFFTVSDGGIFHLAIPYAGATFNLSVDVTIILLMVVSVGLLGIAKSLFEAITILTENSTELDLE
jgi:hypothetical protein